MFSLTSSISSGFTTTLMSQGLYDQQQPKTSVQGNGGATPT
jgi:hypothetical protein